MPNFYTQMEKKTQRVKSVAFHHTKPILLTAHHTGTIKAYDYQTSSLIHEFNDHEGPVRTIIFHPFINIFVSGGDDCTIRIWSYNERKVITKLKGHTDYIRSLDFHPNLPWILSASDDQTIKIWNFQSYKLLATLTGHSHYVMSAKFLTQDYIISASLDQSLRLWDCKSLKTPKNKKSIDILKVPEVIVRQILDGHEKGINWISVHPNTTMFATSSDDRQIKIWELVGEMVKERDVFHHHQGNVSSVLFINNLLISNGEDGILCIYDLKNKKSKKIIIEDRFWCISTNKDNTLFCVGHDTGFKVFSVDRQIPVFSVLYTPTFSGIFYLSGNILKFNNLKTERNIFTTKKEVVSIHSLDSGSSMNNTIHTTDNTSTNTLDTITNNTRLLIQYNNTFDVLKNNKLIFSGNGKGILTKQGILTHYNSKICLINNEGSIIKDSLLFTDEDIHFKDENTFLILKSKSISFIILSDRELESERDSSTHNPNISISKACFVEKCISLSFKPVKCICKEDRVAVLGIKEIAVLTCKDNNMSVTLISSTVEPVGINHGFFYKEGFIYSTKRHLKYLLNSSDTGILKSVEKQIYVFYLCDDFIFYLTSVSSGKGYTDSGKGYTNNTSNALIENVKIDFTEFEFKLSVNKNEDNKIVEIIRNGKLLGLSFLSFLIKNNKGMLVLPSVSNVVQKIEILLSVGRLEECLEIICGMGDKCIKGVNNSTSKQQGVSDRGVGLNGVINTTCNYHPLNTTVKLLRRVLREAFKRCNFTVCEKCLIMLNDNHGLFMLYICNKRKDLIKQIKNVNLEILVFLGDKREIERYISREDSSNTSKEDKDSISREDKDSISREDKDSISREDKEDNSNIREDNNKPTVYSDYISGDRIDKSLLRDIDFKVEWGIAMNNTTEGKFNVALQGLRVMVHNLAYRIMSGEMGKEVGLGDTDSKDSKVVNEKMNKEVELGDMDSKDHTTTNTPLLRHMLGTYVSGLGVEKKKKKCVEVEKCMEMSCYFSRLELLEVHKVLALSNYMMVCFKNENFTMAKEVARELKGMVISRGVNYSTNKQQGVNNNTLTQHHPSAKDVNMGRLEKSVKRVLMSEKSGDKYFIGKGVFCYDLCCYKEEGVCCKFCGVYSYNEGVCQCCEVGVVKR